MRVQARPSAFILIFVSSILFILSNAAGTSAQADFVGEIRLQSVQNPAAAKSELDAYKAQHGVTPEYLEALSWMARACAFCQAVG
jgi:ribonuclease I